MNAICLCLLLPPFMAWADFSRQQLFTERYPEYSRLPGTGQSFQRTEVEKGRSILCISDYAAKLCGANALPAIQGSLCGVWNPEMIWRQNFKNIRRTGAHAICDGPFSVALQRLWHIFLKTENTKGTNPFKGKETTKDEPEKIAKEPV